jgi:hypothetical protein
MNGSKYGRREEDKWGNATRIEDETVNEKVNEKEE